MEDASHFIAIRNHLAARRFQECLQACQNILRSNPGETYAYKYAGKSLSALGQFEKAQECLVKAHQLDDSDPEVAQDIGNIFVNLGNRDAALGWYEKALEINHNYAPAFNNIANIKRQAGSNQEAADLFKRAIQADPKLIHAYVGAAASFLALGAFDEAKSFADQALAINQSVPGVNEILGIIHHNKNNHDQAIEHYQKELGVNPQASNSFLNLGFLLLQKGHSDAALKSLVKASTLAPSEQCTLLLAQAYQNLGRFGEAIIEYKKLDINQSKDKTIPFNFGICLLNVGNNVDAIEVFKMAIQLDDKFSEAWGQLAFAYQRVGLNQDACLAVSQQLTLMSKKAQTTANIPDLSISLGQKLVSQDLIPTFFDHAVMESLRSSDFIENFDIPQLYEDLSKSKNNRFVKFSQRKSRTNGLRLDSALSIYASQGTHSLIKWKDFDIYKSSNDLIIYWMLFNELKPDLIIEIGSGSGGSAVWMSDICKALGLETEIYSYDINKPKFEYENVTFVEFNLNRLGSQDINLPMANNFKEKKKIVIEDAHVNMKNVLLELDRYLDDGDYLVVEDSGNKQGEIQEFTDSMGKKYQTDQFYLDFFGFNMTCSIDSVFKIFANF